METKKNAVSGFLAVSGFWLSFLEAAGVSVWFQSFNFYYVTLLPAVWLVFAEHIIKRGKLVVSSGGEKGFSYFILDKTYFIM